MAQTPELTVVLKADNSGLTGTLRTSVDEVKKFGREGSLVAEAMARKAREAQEAADKAAAATNRATDSASAFGKVLNSLALAAALGGFATLAKHQLDLADATGKLAERLGTTTEFLSAMGYAAKSNGSSVEGFNAAMVQLVENATKAASGQKEQAAAFKALGISVRDASGHLKSVDQLLPEVATKITRLRDATDRAGAAQDILGGKGNELLLTLKQLAEDGMEGVTAKAERMGQVIGPKTAAEAAKLNDQLSALNTTMAAFANQFLREIVPSLTAYGEAASGAMGKTSGLSEAATVLANAFKGVALVVVGVKNAVEALTTVVAGAVDANVQFAKALGNTALNVVNNLNGIGAALSGQFVDASQYFKRARADLAAVAGNMRDVGTAVRLTGEGVADAFGDVTKFADSMYGETTKATGAMGVLSTAWKSGKAAALGLFDAVKKGVGDTTEYASAKEKALHADRDAARAAMEAARAAREAEKAERERAESIKQLALQQVRAQVDAGKLTRAQGDYIAAIIQYNAAAQQAIKRGVDRASVEATLAANTAAAVQALDRETEAEQRRLDIVGRLNEALEEELKTAGLSNDQRRIEEQVLRAAAEARELYQKKLRASPELSKAEEDAIRSSTAAILAESEARDIARQDIEDFQRTVASGFSSVSSAVGDFLTGTIKSWGDFGRSLLDSAKRMVADLIAQFFQLSVIRPLLASIFGGSYSVQAAAGQSALGAIFGGGAAGGGGGGMGSLMNLGGTLFSGGGGNIMGNLGQTARSVWYGGGGLSSNASGFVYNNPAAVGPPVAGAGGPWGGTLGGFSTVGLAGAGIGLSYGLSRGDGGVGTALSGAAGATAGYAVGAAAATAISSGVAAGLAAVPVVGWIALAALLVDKISGGKLFGTKYRPESATQTLSIGEGGGSASLSLYETRQKAFFGGKQSRTKSQDPGDDARKAAEEFFAAIQQTMTSAAKALAVEVPPVIDASIRTVTEYDKKGKVKATKILVDAIGRTWEEATAELAQQRINAEAIIATVGKSAADASGIAEQWRGSAEKLFQGAQLLLAAQVDIKNGAALLGATATLGDTVKVVSDLAQSGEALLDTYARLVKETKAVQDAFALAGATLQKTGTDLVKFADDIASAAGGGDAAQQLWQRFFTAFYSEAELAQRQVDQLRPRLTTDLTALGLDADTTQAQFRAAFEAALPKLSPDEVVKWLRAADELASFYELSAKAGGAAQDAVRSYAGMVADLDNQIAELSGGGITDFQKALGEIAAAQKNTVAQLNAAARAAGLQGAREEDLSKVHQIAAARAAAAARQLEAQSRDLVQRLYGGGADTLTSAAQSASSALGSVATGLGGVADAASRFRDSMLLDSQLSPLNAQQQLQEAMKQLRATGDEGTARRALEIARGLTASGDDYRQLFDQITALVRPQAASGGGSRGGGYDASASAQQTLSPAERADLAQQLARNVADLSGFGDKTYAEVAQGLGLDLGKLGQDLGLQGQALTDYLDSLKADSYSLDDVDGVITRQVDRIVSAILRGQDVTGSLDTTGVANAPKGTPETIPPPPAGGLPASASQTAPASAQQADATNTKLDVVASKLDKIADGLLAVARVAAGTGEDTVSALREVEQAVVDVRRELGSSFSTGNVRTLVP